jgi:hypothetical protein
MRSPFLLFPAAAFVFFNASAALAVDADPATLGSVLPTLQAGDTLNLAPGTYTQSLNVSNLQGTEAAWITITGPASGPPAVFEGNACCNTVEITNSSYVAIKSITVDGKGINGVFGVSAKGSSNNMVHHITIEGCTFVGQNGSQQTVAISTKTPTWGWTIRGNVIDGAGTGLYLGNSNFAEPFIGGVIENNVVKNTIGYNMQIKNQNPWPDHPGIPDGDARTIIRNNVFIKDNTPSPDGARPNVLVGAPPTSGKGSGSLVEVYGNVFVHNGPEALVQATGRVTLHDNIFVDAGDAAILIREHDGFAVRLAHVYNNTIFSAKRGIVFGTAATEGDAVLGNLIFADTPTEGPIASLGDNLGAAPASAAEAVTAPSLSLGSMDFYPLPGKAKGAPLDLSAMEGETAYGCDFNGNTKGDFSFRGAYAGEGANPGWKLAAEVKPLGGSCEGGAGGGGAGPSGSTGSGADASGSGSGSGAGGSGAGAGAGGGDGGGEEGSCGCRAVGAAGGAGSLWVIALSLSIAALRRRRTAKDARRKSVPSSSCSDQRR